MEKVRAYVGTSGWQYREWRTAVYPDGLPQRAWLSHLATRFSTVEVNNTFYRLPERTTFLKWSREVPPEFVFAVKMSRYVTHIRRLRDVSASVETFCDRARGLGAKLGPVLVQLPPRFPVDLGRLQGLLEAVPSGIRIALEVRDRSWHREDVFAALDASGAALVLARPTRKATEASADGRMGLSALPSRPAGGTRLPHAELGRRADRLAASRARMCSPTSTTIAAGRPYAMRRLSAAS